jgi:OmcA/MtrC family decaheme c-type cytochrome
MLLESAPQWTAPAGASRLAMIIGWEAVEYSNEGSGSTPGLPVSLNALNVGGVVQALGGGDYRIVTPLPSGAGGTVTIGLEGHPAADIDGDGIYSDRIAVRNVYASVATDGREPLTPRRAIVDIAKCNACHDSAGAGISLHGNNRTSEDQVCVVCHNGDVTDINRRPADPTMTLDGKKEETIDFKRMIHQIHMGEELQNGVVIYGFGGSANDFTHVNFIGNMANCETCHLPGTYSTEQAWMAMPTTIDTGADLADPEDDLNISPVATVCSSCHDSDRQTQHMLLEGASFQALDENIR